MQVYGLVGNPVGHSLSPPMHEAAYEHTGLDARYVTFEPEPSAIEAAVDGADALGIAGLNVTIPFKQDVLDLVDPDPLAARIGAVNTIDFEDGDPKGYNTDAAGVTRAFERHDISLDGANAVVVGAGGAGRAAAFALADAGAAVHIANRTAETAGELADVVPGATGGGLDTLDRIQDASVLVNATSVGMEAPDETPVPATHLHGDLAVLDAVYAPLETRLLREAADAGAVTIDGAWMLLLQGVEAFELWTGLDAPIEEMNTTLRTRLERH
ncbi:shikimate dehydrogenase [Haloferax mediterranei ATCC 33500]|uniref:Shikimate dehydrogenase (NADP(+)) n=1 Tax=Haloferax mediterranei (strain ATCC 33500 / DSM 1411 / JCM 8866 / NBRC 14739 / NCIMB 2177 / R-4) TaxID=523841 RepID=I3R2D5_HALMT|nr:shikimate dehydrogenase [Haloferax mediterranei]AFK18395.1 shikimate 5-dehydrogenase [Haloferax mediterranei ATCC 33500]AHZ22211.1 shikimate dehydrogenase [Haloferax mediterranei ATCC 33500]EMA02330.1 shikimate 5-dehydrogenase [Haloferax mediterranei ATCC 33500]MDX5988487.1 shikimate dehydrogenase [Haloferax mediterranei ATCC 33500]QCQ74905.1 shikimate dehydrogenase [Haloferax mediterranei ATCC 33500]